MANWVTVGPAADFAEGSKRCVHVAGKELVLISTGGTFYAIRNLCPHAGLPLADGEQRGLVLTCPFHGYAYNVKTGRNIDWPHDEPPVKTYPTRVQDGTIQVAIEEPTVSEKEQQRGPAPEDHPSEEKPRLANSGEPLDKPEAPDGYPDEEQQIPQMPRKDDPKPKPNPTEKGN